VQGPLGWYAELTIDAFFEWLQLIALITLNGFIDQPFFLCQGKVCKEYIDRAVIIRSGVAL
jgi:hypothetical protein